MKFYKDLKNVKMYESMIKEYDPTFIINEVKKSVELKAKGLEIGIGTGIDLIQLNKYFEMEGSDYSEIFIERFQQKNHEINVFLYDVLTMDLETKYDFIYANKVFQHFTTEQLKLVLKKEYNHLNTNGKLIFTLWRGDIEATEIIGDDLRFTYYQLEDIKKVIDDVGLYKIEIATLYKEDEMADSIYIVLRK